MPTAPVRPVARPTARWRGGLTTLTYRVAGAVLQHVPDRVTVPVAEVVARALLPRRAAELAMYRRHLARVLGRPLGPAEAARADRAVSASYARYWVEVFSLPGVPGTVVDARMQVISGWPALQAALESDRGVILALPHVGAWEWGGAWLAHLGHPMTAVAEVLEPPALFDWFARQRQAMGITVLPLSSSAGPALMRILRAGGLIGLVADRDLPGTGTPVTFFGEETTMPSGPATLALRTGAALFPTAVYQGPGRLHSAVILPAVDTARTGDLRADVRRVTQAVADGFEDLIRRAPEQWYCFQANWPTDGDGAPAGAGPPDPDRERQQVP